jgi:hypothetical protein
VRDTLKGMSPGLGVLVQLVGQEATDKMNERSTAVQNEPHPANLDGFHEFEIFTSAEFDAERCCTITTLNGHLVVGADGSGAPAERRRAKSVRWRTLS